MAPDDLHARADLPDRAVLVMVVEPDHLHARADLPDRSVHVEMRVNIQIYVVMITHVA